MVMFATVYHSYCDVIFATAFDPTISPFLCYRTCPGIKNAKSILVLQVILYIPCLKNLTRQNRIRAFLVLYISCIGEWILHYLISAKFCYQHDCCYTG